MKLGHIHAGRSVLALHGSHPHALTVTDGSASAVGGMSSANVLLPPGVTAHSAIRPGTSVLGDPSTAAGGSMASFFHRAHSNRELMQMAPMQEAIGWLDLRDAVRGTAVDQELYGSQGMMGYDLYDAQQGEEYSEYAQCRNTLAIFRVVVFGLETQRFRDPNQVYIFLKDLVVPKLGERDRRIYAEQYELVIPWIVPLLGEPRSPVQLPTGPHVSRTPAVAVMAERLAAAGLRQIGDSAYFERGPFLVHVRDEVHLQVSNALYELWKMEDVRAIIAGERYGTPSLELLLNENGELFGSFRTGNSSSGSVEDMSALRAAAELPMEEQLVAAGFAQDPQAPGVFTKSWSSYNSPHGILTAMVFNDRLQRLDLTMSADIQERVTEHSSLTRYGAFQRRGDSPRPALVFIDAFTEFSVTTFGIERQVPKVPLEQFAADALGVRQGEPTVDPETGFVYDGPNASALIAELPTLNGVAIDELERRMRPNAMSGAGFLGPDESLRDVLVMDNDWVLSQGLTHQQLADVLGRLRGAELQKMNGETELMLHGRRFRVEGAQWMGFQSSPFESDSAPALTIVGASASFDVHVTNLDTGKTLQYSALMPYLIGRFGFYEGQGTSYRVSPQSIVEVFDFLQPKKTP